MILLLGGTSDASPIAASLARDGYRVLVSKATDVPLAIALHPNVEVRSGPLDERSLAELIDARSIRAVVDATHPYATTIRHMADRVAREKAIPYFSFIRPAAVTSSAPGVEIVPDHGAAALAAFRYGQTVLLTTGTRNLGPYVEQSRSTGVRLVARVLDQPDSVDACLRAGITSDAILACRGPFSVEENRRHIRSFDVGVLVSKDSGEAGGTPEKLEAARAEGCRVVIVARPTLDVGGAYSDLDSLLLALSTRG